MSYKLNHTGKQIDSAIEQILATNPVKTFYTGAWTTGNVSMSGDASKYNMFGVRTSSNGGKMIVHRIDSVIRGGGLHCTANTIELFTFSANVLTSSSTVEVWTKVAFGYTVINTSGGITNTVESTSVSSKAGVYQIEGIM